MMISQMLRYFSSCSTHRTSMTSSKSLSMIFASLVSLLVHRCVTCVDAPLRTERTDKRIGLLLPPLPREHGRSFRRAAAAPVNSPPRREARARPHHTLPVVLEHPLPSGLTRSRPDQET